MTTFERPQGEQIVVSAQRRLVRFITIENADLFTPPLQPGNKVSFPLVPTTGYMISSLLPIIIEASNTTDGLEHWRLEQDGEMLFEATVSASGVEALSWRVGLPTAGTDDPVLPYIAVGDSAAWLLYWQFLVSLTATPINLTVELAAGGTTAEEFALQTPMVWRVIEEATA